MHKVRSVVEVSCNLLRKSLNVRVLSLLALSGLMMLRWASPVRAVCTDYQVVASPLALFVYTVNDSWLPVYFSLGWLVIISGAPFLDAQQPYLLLRCGRYRWCVGQMLYLLEMSVLYTMWLFLVCLLTLAGHWTWDLQWDIVFRSLARQSSLGITYGVYLYMPVQLQTAYTLPQAFWGTFCLTACLYCFLGMFVFLLNLLTGGNWGVYVAGGFVMMGLTANVSLLPFWTYYLSPFALANLNMLDPYGTSVLPSLTYANTFFLAGLFFMAAGSLLAMRGRPIRFAAA